MRNCKLLCMKKFFLILAVLCAVLSLPAQTNMPIRLALISETDEALPAADLLTAKFSSNDKIQLLERDQIEKVYREQGLSAANTDYLKLGKILGADGLLLLNVVRTPQSTNLIARLVAVKPGVILTGLNFEWPLKGTTEWSKFVSVHLNSFFPKLLVLPKEAIPISVVNLRSAIASTEAAETERQLKLLAIQRLSQEQQIFVLERQKMQLLGEEKDLKADDSNFWDGSYLLDGVIDQNGYSPGKVTINAHITPPKGGSPILIEASGSRTNLTDVVNQLVAKVDDALKINSNIPAWNAADEAANFYEEATWAMRWGIFSEAQAAAESAWVLGKKDLACALVRVNAYVAETKVKTGAFQHSTHYLSKKDVPASPSQWSMLNYDVNTFLRENKFGVVFHVWEINGQPTVTYDYTTQAPDPKNIDRAIHALELYYEFSQNSPQSATNFDWQELGIENLTTASKVLQGFHLLPSAQISVAEKLRDLRALTRSVADLISSSPMTHDRYFVDEEVLTGDEVRGKLDIFECEATWGGLWQDTPEDGITFYRKLMSSPVFSYIHGEFWSRDEAFNHVVDWSSEDNHHAAAVWDGFVQELQNSTNVLWQLEGKALVMAASTNDAERSAAFTNLYDTIFQNADALVANPVEVIPTWRLDALAGGLDSPVRDALDQLYYSSGYSKKLETLNSAYRNKTIPLTQTAGAFEKQKKYLADFTPYNFQTFEETFSARNYTKIQAAELLPLIASYKSNLLVQAGSKSEKFLAQANAGWIEVSYEKQVAAALNPPMSAPSKNVSTPPPPPAALPKSEPAKIYQPAEDLEIETNVIIVREFLPIPLDGLNTNQIDTNTVTVIAHHWFEGKLLLDFKYTGFVYSFDTNGNWTRTAMVVFPAIAILDLARKHWEVIACPENSIMDENTFYSHTVLWGDDLFTSNNGQIKKYDFQNRRWQVLPISDGGNYELFVVNGHLYAANGFIIFEIVDGGKSTRILASARRQPPASALDRENFGIPFLFEGPNHSLRVRIMSKIFTWKDSDWHEDFAIPQTSFTPIAFTDGLLLSPYRDSQSIQLFRLLTKSNAIELCLRQDRQVRFNSGAPQFGAKQDPLWKLPPQISLATASAAIHQSDLYLLTDHAESKNIVDERRHLIIAEQVMTKNGYHAGLFRFSPESSLPQKMFLKFDAADGCPPTTGRKPDGLAMISALPSDWMLFTTNLLIFGMESPANFPGYSESHIATGYKAGVWLLPLAQLEPAIAAQKQMQLTEQMQAAAKAEQTQKDFLAKYDLNHNGVIDRDELENALDDSTFIASQLDLIDTNHNGRLDLPELAYFDANQNKILDPKEQAGIDIAQHLLAARIIQTFDANNDGSLNSMEFQAFDRSTFPDIAEQSLIFGGSININRVNADGLTTFLNKVLRWELHRAGAMTSMPFGFPPPRSTADEREGFKMEVGMYWQGATNRMNRPAIPPFNHPPFFLPGNLRENTNFSKVPVF